MTVNWTRLIGPEVFKVRKLLCSSCSGKGTGLACSECSRDLVEERDALLLKIQRMTTERDRMYALLDEWDIPSP